VDANATSSEVVSPPALTSLVSRPRLVVTPGGPDEP